MADQIQEQIATEIAALTNLMKEHANGDRATVDVDQLVGAVNSLVDSQVAAKFAQAEAKRPLRKGELVGVPGLLVGRERGVVESGRFRGAAVDDVLFARNFIRRAYALEPERVKAPSKELEAEVQKALSATGSTAGDEWVPTGMAAQLWADAFLSSRVVGAVNRIAMPTDPYDSPLVTIGTWRKGTSNTAATASDPTTGKSTLTSTEQVLDFSWSYDLDEDAVVAEMPAFRAEVARDAAEQMDRFLMNADSTNAATGNINLDDADPADDSYYLSNGQDGIRHLYIVDNTGQSTDINTTLTDALLRAGIGRLGKYGAMTDRLAIVTNPKTYVLSMLSLTNVVTFDKFGPNATVLTGQLGSYGGIPVIPSAAVELAEDDGKLSTTGSNNDEGQIAIFHRDMWRVGFRRELLIEVDRNIQKRQFIMVASFRIAVGCRGTRASQTHTAGIHGITYS